MTKAFICDRCGEVMERAADNITQVKNSNNSEDTKYHHCDGCISEVMVYCAGNE